MVRVPFDVRTRPLSSPQDRLVEWPTRRPSTVTIQNINGHTYACGSSGEALLYLGFKQKWWED
jgi:hypothetical protein